MTNVFAPVAVNASPRSKLAPAFNCPMLTSLTQFMTILVQVTGDFGVVNAESLLSFEEGVGISKECDPPSALGYAQ